MAPQFITPRQRKYLDILTKDPLMPKRKAKQLAGFSAKTHTSDVETPKLKAAVSRLLRQRCPAHVIVDRIAEGLNATETKLSQFEGKFTDQRDMVAWGERRAYAELALEIGYGLKEKESANQVNLGVTIINGVTAAKREVNADR